MSAGGRHTCGTKGGRIECKGDDTYGQLLDYSNNKREDDININSNNSNSNNILPNHYPSKNTIDSSKKHEYPYSIDMIELSQEVKPRGVSSGWDYSCGVSLGGKVGCWGLNILGQTDLPGVIKGVQKITDVIDHEGVIRRDGDANGKS